ncbi:MAG: ABC transporter transmembrane domain-containing protein [Xenococcaceae cyanobacterium]
MKLIHLLLKNSWVTVTLAAFIGLLSGTSSAGLIAVINFTLQQLEQPPGWLAWSFAGLCMVLLVTTAASLILMTRLSQKIIFDLRVSLTQSILTCPLRHLEVIGAPRLLAALTKDVEAIANASGSVSGLCVNVALLLGCFIYLSWLSVPVFLFLLAFTGLGVVTYQFLTNQGRQSFKLARETQDLLFGHFQAVTEGTKELKLHRQRRHVFIWEELREAAAALRRYWVEGMSLFAIAGGWGLVLFFIPIGLLLGLDSSEGNRQTQEYLSQLQLDHKVQVKEGVLTTTNLSQGQRKRLALLTAYLEDRPIYVFDEWASDQDPVFKEIFYRQLLPKLKQRGKTVLVVSHDDRYFDSCDRIVKLDYGQVVSDH